MKNNNARTLKYFLCVLDVLMICFIFINSMHSADISSQHSLGVREFINYILSLLNINFVFTDHIVRKCAHFAEYFVLGVLLYSTAHAFADKIKRKLTVVLLSGVSVAVIDEIIQVFSPGRACQISDVILDFCGVILATVIMVLIFKLRSKFIKDKEVSNWEK